MSEDAKSNDDQPPIDRIVLRDEQEGRDTRHLEARIDAEGDLVLEGQDLGPQVRKFFRTGEYEYFYKIPAGYKDTLLLKLLKEKFDEGVVLDKWLKEHGVPYRFFNWYSPD
jgi:hypothetical protein